MDINLSTKEFTLFQKYVEEKCGIGLSEEKAYLIESRLFKFLVEFGLTSFEELYWMLGSQNNSRIAEKVIDAMTTNETSWFRDKTPWNVMENKLLPEYISALRLGKSKRIRIWSAACSTGQEPYSIAMCIDRYLAVHGITDISLAQFDILATDISNTVLQIAKMGKYDNISITRGLDSNYKNKYFQQQGRVWVLDESIKQCVTFKQHNLQNSFIEMSSFDIVFCRHVTIYFSNKLKEEVLAKMARTLKTSGVLFLGGSELFFGYAGNYECEHYENGVFYKKRSER